MTQEVTFKEAKVLIGKVRSNLCRGDISSIAKAQKVASKLGIDIKILSQAKMKGKKALRPFG